MSEVNAKAAELFAAGESVNGVARALFKGNWGRAKQQHAAWLEETGGAASESAPKRGRRAKQAAPAEDAEAESPESFDLGTVVQAGKLDRLLGTFTVQEKAHAVAVVIQARMDALLEA